MREEKFHQIKIVTLAVGIKSLTNFHKTEKVAANFMKNKFEAIF
jgi:hypothetical protein